MKPRLYRLLQALLLIGLGDYLLFIILSRKILWYINTRFVWLTVLGVIGLIAFGLVILIKLIKAQGSDEDPAHVHTSSHEHHEHERLSVTPLLFLLFPILLGVLVPARPLSTSAIQNRGTSMNSSLSQGGAFSAEPEKRTILDWIRIFNYEPDLTPFLGQTANVIGFVYHDPRFPEQQFMLSRFAVTCCSADAFALGMVVAWPDTQKLPSDSWVVVKGPVETLTVDGKRIPLIRAESVQSVQAPNDPYLFP